MNRITHVFIILLTIAMGGIDSAHAAPGVEVVNPPACLAHEGQPPESSGWSQNSPCRLDDAVRYMSYAEVEEAPRRTSAPGANDWVMPRTTVSEQDVGMRGSARLAQAEPQRIPAVPEPATYLCMLAGLIVIAVAGRKKRQPKLPS